MVTAEKTIAAAWLQGLGLWRLGEVVEVELRSSSRAATTKISGLDMDAGCYEDSQVVKGGVGKLEPRLEPLRTSRELALGNIGIGQGVINSSNEDP
jgi:hypothetical protein